MRETKFKAWDKRNKGWLSEKDFVVQPDGKPHIVDAMYGADDEDIKLVQYIGKRVLAKNIKFGNKVEVQSK